jgi:hypothetical protein
MTTTTKARDIAGAATPTSRSYRDDLYGWVADQAALLKSGRLSEIDADNIAEELGDVGKEQYDKLESAIRVVLLHLLKWDHQPSHRSKSWVLSIREHRRRIERLLQKNPSLKPEITQATREAYEDAEDDAVRETGLIETTFPDQCPYGWDEILGRLVAADESQSPRKR